MSADFIIPGDIMRALQAELRYRGFGVEGAEAYPMDETGLIIGSALASKDGRQGWVVCVFGRETNVATVKSTTFQLDFTFEGEESDNRPPRFEPEPMLIPVSEAATAIDDPEGFWHQGADLDAAGIERLNESIRDRQATIIGKGSTHWLVTLGRGHVYLVEPVESCGACHQVVWVDEADPSAPAFHLGCFDHRDA